MERGIAGGDTPLLASNIIWEQESNGRGGQESLKESYSCYITVLGYAANLGSTGQLLDPQSLRPVLCEDRLSAPSGLHRTVANGGCPVACGWGLHSPV